MPTNPLPRIFWLSVLGLYLELLLIRWIGTEVRIFAYLQNTVLVVCFLGLGAGMFTSRREGSATRMLGALAALTAALLLPATRHALARISEALSLVADVNIFYGLESSEVVSLPLVVGSALVLTLALMLALLEVFVPMGRWLGRAMDEATGPLVAYSVNVAGSLVGTLLFVAVSVASLPPWAWFLLLGVLLAPLLRPWSPRSAALFAFLVLGPLVGACFEQGEQTLWSPYQKLELRRPPATESKSVEWEIQVNNVGYQAMFHLDADHVAAHPDIYPPSWRGLSQYDLPTRLHPAPERVLIVGAGSGNDVAGALRGGAKHVVAVEIDPAILELGRRHHPDRPYDDPRVATVVDDARSYFATTTEKFDVIAFGLLDSHTTTAMTNARLDHYVYTQESIDRAKTLLADGGVLVMSFASFRPFLSDRIANTLAQAFGRRPLVFTVPASPFGWGGVMFVTGDENAVTARLGSDPALKAAIAAWQAAEPLELPGTTAVATDDWPYLYLPEPGIPPLHLLLAGMAILLVLYLQRFFDIREGIHPWRWSREEGHFAAMGAAFLLLEVQNISKASVVLGNTWAVNAVIISAVLTMVLAANALSPLLRRLPTATFYVLLLATIGGLWFVDLASFAFLPWARKAALVGILVTLPMLFSGLVFARSFSSAEHKDQALGANLLGSLGGALLQSASFLTGLKGLLVLVALLYSVSWALFPDGKARRPGQ
jgi:hypothetical protein